jgi:hypothetical protein
MVGRLLFKGSYRVVRAASGVAAVGVHVVRHGSLRLEPNGQPLPSFQDEIIGLRELGRQQQFSLRAGDPARPLARGRSRSFQPPA